MSEFSQALAAAADKNRQLLSLLSETDYAQPSLQQNAAYISDVKKQLAQTEKELSRLHAITEDERKDHVKYRDSTVKRFAYKLGGQKGRDKFASKQEKEEREFLDAWQRERESKDAHAELSTALSHAETERARLTSDVTRHSQAQVELDALYASIFTGPTPEVPGEDLAESSLQRARESFEAARASADREHQALAALQRAGAEFERANRNIADALSASTWDMWGGGTFADMMERDALSRTQNDLSQGLRHLEEARRAQPAVRALSGVQIDQGHFVSDVLFDNIFSDMAQHDRITNSARQLAVATQQLAGETREQAERARGAAERARAAGEELEAARRELQRIRADAFERYADAGGPPPAYQA